MGRLDLSSIIICGVTQSKELYLSSVREKKVKKEIDR